MSFALVTIFLFFLVIPGVVFKSTYFSAEFAVYNPNRNFIDNLFWATIPSTLFHIIGLNISSCFTGYSVDLDLISNVFNDTERNQSVHSLVSNFSEHILVITVYCVWISLLAYPLGQLARSLVRAFKFDIKYRILRFPNKWWYLLRGESLQFRGKSIIPRNKNVIDSTYIDAFVSNNQTAVIYQGILHDFYVDNDGKLETLVITSAHKKKFEVESANKEINFTPFPCSQFIIPYCNVINLNLRYLSLSATGYEKNIEKSRIYKKWESWFRSFKVSMSYITFALFLSLLAYYSIMQEHYWYSLFIVLTLLLIFISYGLAKRMELKSNRQIDKIIQQKGNLIMRTIGYESVNTKQ